MVTRKLFVPHPYSCADIKTSPLRAELWGESTRSSRRAAKTTINAALINGENVYLFDENGNGRKRKQDSQDAIDKEKKQKIGTAGGEMPNSKRLNGSGKFGLRKGRSREVRREDD